MKTRKGKEIFTETYIKIKYNLVVKRTYLHKDKHIKCIL